MCVCISFIESGSRMALSAAERQRRYREKLKANPLKRQEVLAKGRERWARYKQNGNVKTADEMSDRERRIKRKYWRESKRVSRGRHRASAAQGILTPPNSPDFDLAQQAVGQPAQQESR